MIICGQVTQYHGKLDKPESGTRFLHHLLFKRATVTGILARDYNHRMEEMREAVTPWVEKGEIVLEETLVSGFHMLPTALQMLFEGKNIGKVIVEA